MSASVVVVGAGVGGLAAALRLARRGYHVRVLEARPVPGGLASGFEKDGLRFDGGPYILLDRLGLEWAFRALGLDLAEQVALAPIDDVYEVASEDGPKLTFHADLAETAAGIDRLFPGSGRRYQDLVAWAQRAYARLQPLLFLSRPSALDVLRTGAWRDAPTLLRPLGTILRRAGLPGPLRQAVAVWTYVAGQKVDEAPSFLAFVPALFHGVGAYCPQGGMRVIPEALARAITAAGVEVETGTRVRAIRRVGRGVTGVETEAGVFLKADAVISDVGLATYLELLQPPLEALGMRLAALQLQSPGVCAYLRVRGTPCGPYLRFRIGGDGCRLFIATGVVEGAGRDSVWPARLLGPMDHGRAARDGAAGQEQHLDCLLNETWWREGLDDVTVVARRTPVSWGAEFHLHRDSMNPVMTARLMRAGRLAHRSPWVRGLYLAGSATHPGQWVSFCAISGILAADRLVEDLG